MIDPGQDSASPPASAIEVQCLAYAYPDGRTALRDISFSVAVGESIALAGPNGAGKSTLLMHLNGLLPDAGRGLGHGHGVSLGDGKLAKAGMGSIRIHGREIKPKNLPEIRKLVGLVFQDPDDQLFSVSVLEDVAFGPLNLGMSRQEARRIAVESLARTGMAEALDRPPRHLSYGERKRVALAGVLACGPSVLALDEPSANLDPRARRQFINLLKDLEATKLIATHDLEMALELCPRTIILDRGTIAADGPTAQLFADADLMESQGLEVPLSLRGSLC